MTTTSLRRTLAVLLALTPADLMAQEVLYDQTDVPSTESFPSQRFEEAESEFSSQGGDDFVVPDSVMWSVGEVSVIGAYPEGDGPATSVEVFFYADDAGEPGAELLHYDDLPIDTDADGDLTVTLSPSVILTGGTYWVSLAVDMNSSVEGRWFWTKQATTTPIGAELHWRNPGGGFTNVPEACRTWQPLTSVCGDEGGLDASFRLGGQAAASFIGLTPEAVVATLDVEETGTETVTISNDTDRSVAYTFDPATAGFVTDVSPVRGEVPAGGTADVTLTLSAAGLRSGVYADTLTMAAGLGLDEVTYELPIELAVTAVVGLEGGAVTERFVLAPAYPNPFAGETTVELTLLRAGPVTVEVYDARGRRVAVLVDEERSAGLHRVRWDARDAVSGVYVVRVRVGDATASLPVALTQ